MQPIEPNHRDPHTGQIPTNSPNTPIAPVAPETPIPHQSQTPNISQPVNTRSAAANIPEEPQQVNQKPNRNSVLSYAVIFVLAVGLALFIYTFVVRSYVVVGTSMTPTLQDGNRLIVNKTPVTWHKLFGGEFTPNRGDIIIFDSPIDVTENGMPSDQLIKRVIGLPGDRVVVKNKKITVYNTEHPDGFNPDDKPYGKDLAPTSGDVDIVIPDGFVFVCGDNRIPGGSFDSRSELGPIPLHNIVGKLAIRYMPLDEVSSF